MRALVVVAAAAALLAGCTHTHLDTNAPGHIDPRTRPRTAEEREPSDPGENHVVLAYGPQGGGGAHLTGPSTAAFVAAGAEASLFYGRDDVSHTDDDFFTPERAYGASVGASFLLSDVRDAGGSLVKPGPQLYAEAAMRRDKAFGLGLGWAVDAKDGATGPQATANAGPLFFRATHLLGTGTFLSVGLVLKGQHTWTWSR